MRSSAAVRTIMGFIVVGGMTVGVSQSAKAAGSATENVTVSAKVNGKCTITTTAVDFGTYDPLGAHAAADLDAAGSVTIACTKNAVATVGLGTGQNHDGGSRRMTGGGEFLAYDLYSDADRLVVWDEGDGLLEPAAAADKEPRTFPVYGRVFKSQDVPAADFADTVVATVNF